MPPSNHFKPTRLISKIGLILFLLLFIQNPTNGGIFKSVIGGVTNIFNGAGKVLGSPFGGFLEGMASPMINEAETASKRVLKDFDNKVAARLKDFKTITGEQIDLLDTRTKERLDQFDQIIKDRGNQFDYILKSSLVEADEVIKVRLEQFDENIEKNIGVLDASATRQIYYIENMAIRIIQIIFILILMIVTLKAVQGKLNNRDLLLTTLKKSRNWFLLSGVSLLLAFIIPFFYNSKATISFDKIKKEAQLAVNKNIDELDYKSSLFNASRLSALEPGETKYQAQKLKIELIRDLFYNPTSLSTLKNKESLLIKLYQIEEKNTEADPDLDVIESMILLSFYPSKITEYLSYLNCLNSFHSEKTSKSFKELANNYILNYLRSPLSEESLIRLRNEYEELKSIETNLNKYLNIPPQSYVKNSNQQYSKVQSFLDYNNEIYLLNKNSQINFQNILQEFQSFKSSNDQNEKDSLISKISTSANLIIESWTNFSNKINSSIQFSTINKKIRTLFLNDAYLLRSLLIKFDPQNQHGLWMLTIEELKTKPEIIKSFVTQIPTLLKTDNEKNVLSSFYSQSIIKNRNELSHADKLNVFRIYMIENHLIDLSFTVKKLILKQEYNRFGIYDVKLITFSKKYLDYIEMTEGIAFNTKIDDDVLKIYFDAAYSSAVLGFYSEYSDNGFPKRSLAESIFIDSNLESIVKGLNKLNIKFEANKIKLYEELHNRDFKLKFL